MDVTGAPHVAKTPAALPVSWTELSPADPAAQGWNLVSNPLPAPIDFSLMVRGADVANGYYVYDPATGNNAHWDAEILVSTPPGAVHGIIHSSQGFWVQASGPAATLTVDESAKVDVATGGLFGGDQMPTVGQLRLVIEHGANALRDEARVFFGLGQPGHDGGDALKLPVGHQHAPRIATRSSDGMDMMVNKYGAYEQAISIPVTVRAALTGTHTITLYTAHIGLSCLTLEDLHTGAVMPVTDGTTYSFAQDSTGNAAIVRFMLHASAPVPFTAGNGTCGPLSGRAEVQLATPTDVALSSDGVVLEQYTAAVGTLVFDGLAAGAYTITAGSATACGTLAHSFTIATAGTPVEVALDVPAEAVVQEVIGLHATATEGAELSWDLGDGTTATGAHVMHTYGAPGTYTVGLTATLDDCTVTATTSVVVGASTGIGTHAAEAVQVWHDGGHFVVEHGLDHGGTLTIEVLDATGRLHATAGTVARPGRVLVPAQGLAAGVWFVRISDADRQHTVRVPVLR